MRSPLEAVAVAVEGVEYCVTHQGVLVEGMSSCAFGGPCCDEHGEDLDCVGVELFAVDVALHVARSVVDAEIVARDAVSSVNWYDLDAAEAHEDTQLLNELFGARS